MKSCPSPYYMALELKKRTMLSFACDHDINCDFA
jgi:hypothetical protein